MMKTANMIFFCRNLGKKKNVVKKEKENLLSKKPLGCAIIIFIK